ncbi:MAG: hypothetical protein K0U74_16980 [Alphaproteobacteria bacterium]|nr:hypothetical protein [Alphaproteobacteria bacterium]
MAGRRGEGGAPAGVGGAENLRIDPALPASGEKDGVKGGENQSKPALAAAPHPLLLPVSNTNSGSVGQVKYGEKEAIGARLLAEATD